MLTHARLIEALAYDPESGVFTWRVRNSSRALPGAIAGYLDNKKYVTIRLDGKLYLAHRLAWMYVHGVMPTIAIDHKDRAPGNNRISNLRLATNGENQQNIGRAKSHSTTQLLGAFIKENKFYSAIRVNGVVHRLGSFDTAMAAHEAYMSAKKLLHPRFTVEGRR